MSLSINAEEYKKALVGQMAWEGLPASTIDFFKNIFEIIMTVEHLSCSDMADAAGYTPQAARIHRDLLEKHGYLKRMDYRNWCLSDQALHDPFFRKLLRSVDFDASPLRA